MSLSDWQAAPIYTVTVRYRTGVYPDDDKRRAWLDRSTFNAPGVRNPSITPAPSPRTPSRPPTPCALRIT